MLCKKPFSNFGCGQCLPCRLNLRRKKAARIMLEANFHDKKSFLTLTYDDEHVPYTTTGKYNLRPDDIRLFWNRLRNYYPPKSIHYYAVGEYGHEGDRQWNPHYHAALYGVACDGQVIRLPDPRRCWCDTCALVRKVWGKGNITLDELNDTTSNYTAGYIEKKMTSDDDYRLEGRHPEFSRSSKGLGASAVPLIADAIKTEFGHLALKYDDVPMQLKRGKSAIPLDRYMRTKIRKALNMEKINPDTGEITYGVPAHTMAMVKMEQNPELYSLQKNAFFNFIQGEKIPYEKIEQLKAADASRSRVKIRQVEAKHKIYKSKGAKKL